jgi:Lar family restriction alleviation protein
MNNELKPCPFCGGDAVGDYIFEGMAGSPPMYRIKCKLDCLSEYQISDLGNTEKQKDSALSKWNTRKIERDEFNLLQVIADIRQKAGIGDKVMLSELAETLGKMVKENNGSIL